MRSIFNDSERTALHRRLDRLRPESPARWGRMNAHRMICHLRDAVESGFSTAPVEPGGGALARNPLKWLVLGVLPWPKGKLQSPPDLLVSQPVEWNRDMEALRAALERAAAKGAHAQWPASEVFGVLSGKEWGVLLRTHIDHHLRQFGV
jgi:hypothetical protein